MSFLRGFAPWIVYSLVSVVGWQWGALAALVVSVVSLIADRRKGLALDAQILDLGSLGYFAVLATIAFVDPTSPLHHFDGPLSSAWLALIAITSLLIRRPFTLGIARRRVTPEIAASAPFARLNMVITSFWASAFVFQAVVGVVVVLANAGTVVDIARQVIGFTVPMLLTNRYVARVRARQTATATAIDAPTVRIPALVKA